MEIKETDYAAHKTSVINRLEILMEERSEECETEHFAFDFLAGELFAISTDEKYFCFTDGNDQGVDFYTKNNDDYEIFQCKIPKIETIIKEDSVNSFDDEVVKDIEDAYKYLFQETVSTTPNEKVKNLRAKFRNSLKTSEETKVTFNIAIFGKLTEDAKNKFDILKSSHDKNGVKFNIYTWEDVLREIIFQEKGIKKSFKIKLRYFKDEILKGNSYCYFLGYAKDLYDSFQKYGWALFDLNVRSELRTSAINTRIVESLTHLKGMKNFHHLNNGILIFCDSYSPKDVISLTNPQIINGCQTVRSICRAYSSISNDAEKLAAFEKCLIQIKIIKRMKDTKGLLDQLVISTNDQNPMSVRNLRSNSSEQRKIKSLFDNLPKKWFYQRKDGEFEGLQKVPITGHLKFKISDYKVNGCHRYLDNNDLAKSWLSFIGGADRSILVRDFFSNEDHYNWVFKYYPDEELWENFTDFSTDFDLKNDYFSFSKKPAAEEYLFSYIIWKFIHKYSKSPKKNRDDALEEGVKAKKIVKNSEGKIITPIEGQNIFLSNNIEFVINTIINNCKEVLLEMYSFILNKRYGNFDYTKARKFLNQTIFKDLYEKPDFKGFISTMPKEPENILYSIYEFIRDVLIQLYNEMQADYMASTKRKVYLAQKSFIMKFKQKIIERNESEFFKKYAKEWKHEGKSFFESLPNLP